MHGDVGERLGLIRKRTPAQFIALCDARDSERRNIGTKTWCLGDPCPADYTFPPNWDVLGDLPPMLSLVTPVPPLTTTFTGSMLEQRE